MKREKMNEDRIETLLAGIAYPGDDEEELEGRIAAAGMTDRIMDSLMGSGFPELDSRTPAGRKTYLWAAAALLNIALILLFEAWPALISSSVGTAEVYAQLIFLAFGMAASVSIIGCVLSLNPSQIDKLIPAFFIRES